MAIKDALANAAKLVNAGRLEQADSLCTQIIKARPNLPDAHNILAVVRHKQGKLDEAIASLKKAIKLNANVPNFYSNLGEMERLKGNWTLPPPICARRFRSIRIRRRHTTISALSSMTNANSRKLPTAIAKRLRSTTNMPKRTTIWATPCVRSAAGRKR